MGSFENEIMLWLHNLRQYIYRHERFTWINLVLSIIPLPAFGLLAILLACLQLYFCSKGKIPKTEKSLLSIALILGIVNFTLATFLLIYLAKEGWLFWNAFDPFLLLDIIKEKLFNRDINRDIVNIVFN